MADVIETPKKKPVTKKKTAAKKTAAKKTATTKKLTALEQRMLEFEATLAALRGESAAPAAEAPVAVAEPVGEVMLFDAKLGDLPTVPEIRQCLWKGVRGELTVDEQSLANFVREATAARGCLLCGASSHKSMAAGPWNKVRLCACPLMRVREDPNVLLAKQRGTKAGKGRKGKGPATEMVVEPVTPAFLTVYEPWLEARKAADGGIGWLREQVEAQSLTPATVLYRKQCACSAQFAITAGVAWRAIRDHDLGRYVEATKCLKCARAAETRRDSGVEPRKRSSLGTLGDVMAASQGVA